MSDKAAKVARKVLRQKIQIEGKAIAISLQNLILKFSFRMRLSIAWKIVRGKPFLGGTGITEEPENKESRKDDKVVQLRYPRVG